MKRIIVLLFALATGLWAVSCTPDKVAGLSESGVPSAGELDVTIAVDQTTNFVTFTLNNAEMTPMWIFSESDFSTQNNLSRRFRNAGTYTVEVKAMNRNGLSDASMVKEFTLENNYVVPSHPLYGTGSKRWKIASQEFGHMGLGPELGNTSWWAAGPGEKAAYGMYDDRITFTDAGAYVYDPGPDGMTYVRGSSSFNDGTHSEDFDYPSEREETTYTLNGDETVLTLPRGTFLPWIASDAQLDSSVYTILELTDEQLILAWQVDAEAWQIILEPADVMERDPLWGAGSKEWKIASGEYGHMGLGPELGNTSWWAAGPDEKADYGMYDDRVTFTEEGAYIYDPGPDGMTYVRGSSSFNDGTHSEDFDYPSEREETTYTLNGDNTQLTLPRGTFLPWIASDAQLDSSVYTILELTSTKLILAWQVDAEAWQIILEPANAPEPPPPFNPGPELDKSEYGDLLAGSWTWESSSFGHFGCGETIGDPLNWWAGPPGAKDGCSMYDDVITFGPGNAYRFDPVDGMTYMNGGVEGYTGGEVVDSPLGDDFRVTASVQESTYTFNGGGEFPSFTLPAGILFSYICNDDQLAAVTTYYITAMWENQIEISWYTPTGNDGGPIAWRYRLKRVS